MTPTSSHDLGHGVRVMPGNGGGIVVQSSDFDLGWRTRVGERPGAAVMWEGSSFEVVEREPWRHGGRWTLTPWTGEDVMRVVLPLDGTLVDAVAREAQISARADRLRPWLYFLAPALGFAATSWQRRWRDDWGYPAAFGTWLSAIIELALGGACIMELIASARGDITIFSWIPRPLIYFGLPLCLEAIVRMIMVASDSEPVGSGLGLAVSAFERRRESVPESVPSPEMQTFDPVAGSLKLFSPIHRRDWEEPGLLPYRGGLFALDSTERQGEAWVYVFGRLEVAEGWDGRRLRLVPPRSKVEARSFAGQPGPFKTVLLTIACTLAPRRFQERWAWELGVGEKWFTVIGSSAELIGGLSNLGAGNLGSLALLLNLFFVFEAAVRFASLSIRGRPMGSLIGLPLSPILEHFLPEPRALPTQST